jgi:L-serine/L-threonine ammonia-lyase
MKATHVVTPLWESRPMSAIVGRPVLLKMEAFQPSGSFKARGMGAVCRDYAQAGVGRVICASGGNAGYAVACAGRQLGLAVTIVVPTATSARARELILAEGAELVVHGAGWDEAHAYALELVAQGQGAYVHPFDDPRVWSGHATMITEMAEAGVQPGQIVVSVGGGGLLCGLAEGLHQVGWTDVPIVAAETEGAASFARSLEAGRLVTLDKISSIATTLGARTVTPQALAWAGRHPISSWVMSDRAAVEACLRFADDHRVLVEPACGAALAAVYGAAEAVLAGVGPVVVIVCGGVGVNLAMLEKWQREL